METGTGIFHITSIVLAIQHHIAENTLTLLHNTSLEKKCVFHYISWIMFQQHLHGHTPPVDRVLQIAEVASCYTIIVSKQENTCGVVCSELVMK